MTDGQFKPKWKGDDTMQYIAEKTEPEMTKMLSEMSTAQLEGAQLFYQFWKTHIGAGHGNLYKMAPKSFEAATSQKENGHNDQPD